MSIHSIMPHSLKTFLVFGVAFAITSHAERASLAGSIATASAYDFERGKGEKNFSDSGLTANIQDEEGVITFRVASSPGYIKVGLQGKADSNGPAVSGTGQATGTTSDSIHVLFFGAQVWQGHLLNVEDMRGRFYPVIDVGVDGTITREETSGAAQANGSFEADVFFGGKRETLLDYNLLLDQRKDFEIDRDASEKIIGNVASSYGDSGISLRLVYSAQLSVNALGEDENAHFTIDYYDTMKVNGFGMVDADGNYIPTSFYSITTDSGLDIPLIGPPVSVPEPGTAAVFGLGVLGFAIKKMRRKIGAA